jgi:hypothetical protein
MKHRRPVERRMARESRLGFRPGSCPGVEPGELAELAIAGCRGTADDPGFADSADVDGAVAAGVADLVAGAAGHVCQADQADVGASLFAGLPGRCRGGRIADVHGAARDTPAVVMAGQADQKHPSSPTGPARLARAGAHARQRLAAWLCAQRYPPG